MNYTFMDAEINKEVYAVLDNARHIGIRAMNNVLKTALTEDTIRTTENIVTEFMQSCKRNADLMTIVTTLNLAPAIGIETLVYKDLQKALDKTLVKLLRKVNKVTGNTFSNILISADFEKVSKMSLNEFGKTPPIRFWSIDSFDRIHVDSVDDYKSDNAELTDSPITKEQAEYIYNLITKGYENKRKVNSAFTEQTTIADTDFSEIVSIWNTMWTSFNVAHLSNGRDVMPIESWYKYAMVMDFNVTDDDVRYMTEGLEYVLVEQAQYPNNVTNNDIIYTGNLYRTVSTLCKDVKKALKPYTAAFKIAKNIYKCDIDIYNASENNGRTCFNGSCFDCNHTGRLLNLTAKLDDDDDDVFEDDED